HTGGDDLVDDVGLGPLVEVVDELRALVAEIPGVLEPGGALHGRNDTWRWSKTRSEGAHVRSLARRLAVETERPVGAGGTRSGRSFSGGWRVFARRPARWPSGQPPPGSRNNCHSSCWTTSLLWWHQ